MSDVNGILAGAQDASGTPVPAEFSEWVGLQVARREHRPANTEIGVVAYDLEELLGEINAAKPDPA